MRGYQRKRAKGSWTIALHQGLDQATAKRRCSYVTIKGTKRGAERKLTELPSRMDTGVYVRPAPVACRVQLGAGSSGCDHFVTIRWENPPLATL